MDFFTLYLPPSSVKVRCKRGVLTADKLVLATNAWAPNIRELSRSIVVISSDMIATDPFPAV
jgi:glycine/D-amino acid oxidase-like deaminating enzyme